MSGLYNLKLKQSHIANHELLSLARSSARDLFALNRQIDPKTGYEQSIIAREIALGRYINADDFVFDAVPDRLYCRAPDHLLEGLLHHGRIRIESFNLNPRINGADQPDDPRSPYILVNHSQIGSPGFPITLGQRALVFRGSLDPYVHLQRYRSCITIDDPDEFVSCVTEKLNQVLVSVGSRVVRVLHAPCFYQWSRLVGTWRERGFAADDMVDIEDAKYFIKPGYGFHDAEFRFVWVLDQDFEGHVEFQCSDLPQLCSPFTDLVR